MVMLRFGILQNVYNLFKDLRKTNSLINVILQYQATLCFITGESKPEIYGRVLLLHSNSK